SGAGAGDSGDHGAADDVRPRRDAVRAGSRAGMERDGSPGLPRSTFGAGPVGALPGPQGVAGVGAVGGRKERHVGITRNDLEEAFLGLVDRFGLPRPRMNAFLAVRDRFYEIDCLWEDRRVAIELDGG